MVLHLVNVYIKPLLGVYDLTWFFAKVEACLILIWTIEFLCLNSLSSFTHLLNISLDISSSVNRATLGRLLRIIHEIMLSWCLYLHVDRYCPIRAKIYVAASISVAHYGCVLFLKGSNGVKSYFPLCFNIVHIDDSINIFKS